LAVGGLAIAGLAIAGSTGVVRRWIALRECKSGRPEKNTEHRTSREKTFRHWKHHKSKPSTWMAGAIWVLVRTVALSNLSQPWKPVRDHDVKWHHGFVSRGTTVVKSVVTQNYSAKTQLEEQIDIIRQQAWSKEMAAIGASRDVLTRELPGWLRTAVASRH
jgi:hypothetical protein